VVAQHTAVADVVFGLEVLAAALVEAVAAAVAVVALEDLVVVALVVVAVVARGNYYS
jgi:hypothetical protein